MELVWAFASYATEAQTARFIFQRFIAVGSIVGLVDDLARQGIRSKVRTMRDGNSRPQCLARSLPVSSLT
jgi:hypothetical protein